MNDSVFYPDLATPLWPDRLKRGIWPRSNVYWIGLFYVAMFVMRPWEKLIPELGELRFERVFGILMFVLLATTYKWELRGGLTAVAVLLFALAMWITSLTAFTPSLCEPDLNAVVSTTISFFVIMFVVRSAYQLYFLIATYIAVMFVYLAKAQWEYFVNGAAQYRMGVKRLQGIEFTFGDPNAFGSAIICSLPLVYFLYQIRHDLVSTWPKRYRRLFPWFLHAYSFLATVGVFLTRSRTTVVGFVAFAMLLALSGANLSQKVKRVFLTMMLLCVTFLLLPGDMQGRIQTIWDSSVEQGGEHRGANESARGRIVGFNYGIEMFKKHPITGVGIGNYKEYRVAKLDGVFLDSHNFVAEVLGETGLVGATGFLFLLGVLAFNIRKTRSRTKRNDHPDAKKLRQLAMCLTFILLLLFLQGLSGHNLHRYQWFWIAAFAAISVQLVRALPIVAEESDYEDLENQYVSVEVSADAAQLENN